MGRGIEADACGVCKEAEPGVFFSFYYGGRPWTHQSDQALFPVPFTRLRAAIERGDARFLVQIKGAGTKIADKLCTAPWKVGKYAL